MQTCRSVKWRKKITQLAVLQFLTTQCCGGWWWCTSWMHDLSTQYDFFALHFYF